MSKRLNRGETLKLFLNTFLFCFSFFLVASADAAVDLNGCIQRLEKDTAEQEMINREESGEAVGQLSCKLRIKSVRDGSGVCEKVLKFEYRCEPGNIQGQGGACCPG